MVAYVRVFGDGRGVVSSRKVGTDEEYWGGARGADEDSGDTR